MQVKQFQRITTGCPAQAVVLWGGQTRKETKQMMRISLADFKAKAVERNFAEGRQLYVSSKYFEIVDMKPVKRFIKEVELVA